ncbi:hypothetical protein NQD34_011023 [Periophthalmus magnuspinnatus]|nr:hypothetical protein NQD34_011023 [Periophthalmus magnuspinnatus]
MQPELCSRGTGSLFQERTGSAASDPTANPPSQPAPPHYHPSCSSHVSSLSNFSITGTLPDPSTTAAIPWYDMSLPTRRGPAGCTGRPPHIRSLSDSRDSGYPHSYASVRRRTQSVGVGTHADEEEEEDDDEEEDGGSEEEGAEEEDETEDRDRHKKSAAGHHHHHYNHRHFLYPPPSPLGPPPDPEHDLDLIDQSSYCGVETAEASAAVRRRLAHFLRAADSSMQRRLAKVSTELAQTDTELLCERAHSQHLAQERREVAQRQRSLSRQVDVAVMVIAALREQINASENELERREREVITIQKFLEAAARQETSGKVRIQHFIENLLSRIALAEKLVEYYQVNGSPPQYNHYQHQPATSNGPHRITKSKSAGGPLSSGFPDNRSHCPGHMCRGPGLPKACVERDLEREHRERLAHSSRLFCRPEHRDGIWNYQRRRSAGYEA